MFNSESTEDKGFSFWDMQQWSVSKIFIERRTEK